MEQITEIVAQVVKKLYSVDIEPSVTRPEASFGDFATNIAMQLSGRLGRNPREIAEELASNLGSEELIDTASVAGPGFINLALSEAAVLSLLGSKPSTVNTGRNIVLEYSCPNAFKELHTGHLYQTIFGDILARLLEVSGATVHRTSFGGDVGLHVAKCLYGMVRELGGENFEALDKVPADVFERAHWISQSYVVGAKAYEEEESAKTEIDALNQTIYGFHDTDDHESSLAKIYWTTRQWSFDYFEAFYDLIKVDQQKYYPESSTAGVGLEVVRRQLEIGNLRESEGAVVFDGDDEKHTHTRVFITGRGLPTYETKDIGVIWREFDDFGFDHRYIVTGNDQREYMRVVFAAAEKFRPDFAGKMTHLMNGTVKFSDGSKMSSRLGNVARATDVLTVVRAKVSEIVENQALVEDVTLGAIKYAFAKYKLGGNIAFDVDETVSLAGNSGPYIQYAHARARRILEKSSVSPLKLVQVDAEDRALVLKLGEYNEVIDMAVRELEPHRICTYLFEVAQEFNRYYEVVRVIGSGAEAHRLGIVKIYADILRSGLEILGITAPDKM